MTRSSDRRRRAVEVAGGGPTDPCSTRAPTLAASRLRGTAISLAPVRIRPRRSCSSPHSPSRAERRAGPASAELLQVGAGRDHDDDNARGAGSARTLGIPGCEHVEGDVGNGIAHRGMAARCRGPRRWSRNGAQRDATASGERSASRNAPVGNRLGEPASSTRCRSRDRRCECVRGASRGGSHDDRHRRSAVRAAVEQWLARLEHRPDRRRSSAAPGRQQRQVAVLGAVESMPAAQPRRVVIDGGEVRGEQFGHRSHVESIDMARCPNGGVVGSVVRRVATPRARPS